MMVKLMIITVCMIFAAGSLLADPLLLTRWNWTDESGKIHEYAVVEDAQCSWQKAVDQVVENWHLATITSSSEQTSLLTGLSGLGGQYWLGGYQTKANRGAEDDWAWVTGEEWMYKNWASGEPNDFYGSGTEEFLAVGSMWKDHSWLWNDEGELCNINGFIIERTQSVPEPGTVTLFAIGLVALMILPKKVESCQ